MNMDTFEWTEWFDQFENRVARLRRDEIGALAMQTDQLTAAVKELTDAVNLAVTASQNHTPDAVVAPIVAQISGLATTLKNAFPRPQG